MFKVLVVPDNWIWLMAASFTTPGLTLVLSDLITVLKKGNKIADPVHSFSKSSLKLKEVQDFQGL